MELWLPAPDKWNGKFLMVGNGGWAGQTFTPFRNVNDRYATAQR